MFIAGPPRAIGTTGAAGSAGATGPPGATGPGLGQQLHQPPVAAAIRPAGRGIRLQQAAEAAAIPEVGRGRDIDRPADAAAPPAWPLLQPVRQDQHVQPHMLVLKDLFNFVTSVLRSGATNRTFSTETGYRTLYSIQGNFFW
jgi:hypothetical protein